MNAEIFINKAAHIIHLVEDLTTVIKYKFCHSRVLDSKRKFELASYAYYGLSVQEGVSAEDLETLLNMAITCAMLSPAGPMKARIITVLMKDERSKRLEHFGIL